MMNFFKKRAEYSTQSNMIVAVADGELVSLDKVPDEVFSKRTLGDGVAIQITNNTIVSPADGIISFIYPHAFGITLQNGIEILVHIGVNTIALNGIGFKKLVDKNTAVKKGNKIISIDKNFIERSGYDCITMIIVTDTKNFDIPFHTDGTVSKGTSVIATYENK